MIDTALPEISRKILFVDDEIKLLDGIKRQLRRDYAIVTADGGQAGLEAIEREGPFAVIVSDYNMPVMDGISFLGAVYQKHPDTVRIMLTGRAELELAVNALHSAQISRFLNKPCPGEILQQTLDDGLEQYRLRVSERLLRGRLQTANAELATLNDHLEARVAEKTRTLQLQYRYVAQMAQAMHSRTIINGLLSAVADISQSNQISLWLSPRRDDYFECVHPPAFANRSFSCNTLDDGITAQVLHSLQAWQRTPDADEALPCDTALFTDRPCLMAPLVSHQNVIGLVTLSGEALNGHGDANHAIAAVVDIAATTLQSRWHQEAFEDAQDAIITALAKLSEYRDPETGAHLLRLKKYSTLICQALAGQAAYADIVTGAFIEDLVRSSPLHDIGKVGIPDAILKKPGKLTPEEFEIMKTHAQIGGDTLRTVYEQYPSQSFIKFGMDIAYCHHEKWDGSGYPQGLKGEDIPLAARILSLVDVYDALTCRRVYKSPFSRDDAKTLISQGSGSHFDPALVAIFLATEEAFHDIAERYADV